VPQKKGRTEEGKGGEFAVPCRERLELGLEQVRHTAPRDQQKLGIAKFVKTETRRLPTDGNML
jgi:hypothetical protein